MRVLSLAIAAAIALLFTATLRDAAVAQSAPGTIKVTIVGPDGKPVEGVRHSESELGLKKRSEFEVADATGRVVVIDVYDGAGNSGTRTVYVPDGKETQVTVSLQPDISFHGELREADTARQAGDDDAYRTHYTRAQEALDRDRKAIEETKAAVADWARDNKLPVKDFRGVAKEHMRALDLPPELQDRGRIASLLVQMSMLGAVDQLERQLDQKRATFTEYPKPKEKVSALPSTCPEGQSGGFLAGIFNSVTGTNSLTGICGEEIEKDNKDRGTRDHEEHDRH